MDSYRDTSSESEPEIFPAEPNSFQLEPITRVGEKATLLVASGIREMANNPFGNLEPELVVIITSKDDKKYALAATTRKVHFVHLHDTKPKVLLLRRITSNEITHIIDKDTDSKEPITASIKIKRVQFLKKQKNENYKEGSGKLEHQKFIDKEITPLQGWKLLGYYVDVAATALSILTDVTIYPMFSFIGAKKGNHQIGKEVLDVKFPAAFDNGSAYFGVICDTVQNFFNVGPFKDTREYWGFMNIEELTKAFKLTPAAVEVLKQLKSIWNIRNVHKQPSNNNRGTNGGSDQEEPKEPTELTPLFEPLTRKERNKITNIIKRFIKNNFNRRNIPAIVGMISFAIMAGAASLTDLVPFLDTDPDDVPSWWLPVSEYFTKHPYQFIGLAIPMYIQPWEYYLKMQFLKTIEGAKRLVFAKNHAMRELYRHNKFMVVQPVYQATVGSASRASGIALATYLTAKLGSKIYFGTPAQLAAEILAFIAGGGSFVQTYLTRNEAAFGAYSSVIEGVDAKKFTMRTRWKAFRNLNVLKEAIVIIRSILPAPVIRGAFAFFLMDTVPIPSKPARYLVASVTSAGFASYGAFVNWMSEMDGEIARDAALQKAIAEEQGAVRERARIENRIASQDELAVAQEAAQQRIADENSIYGAFFDEIINKSEASVAAKIIGTLLGGVLANFGSQYVRQLVVVAAAEVFSKYLGGENRAALILLMFATEFGVANFFFFLTTSLLRIIEVTDLGLVAVQAILKFLYNGLSCAHCGAHRGYKPIGEGEGQGSGEDLSDTDNGEGSSSGRRPKSTTENSLNFFFNSEGYYQEINTSEAAEAGENPPLSTQPGQDERGSGASSDDNDDAHVYTGGLYGGHSGPSHSSSESD